MKILLILIWIIGIINFFVTNDPYIIYGCGLFGFIGTDPNTNFSWDKFNILGYINDKRGGDACGRVFNNSCEYGLDKLKTYNEFVQEVKSPTVPIISNTVLGHSRKASSGGKADMYAQPIILRKKDLNMKAIKDTHLKKAIKDLQNDDIVFSGIHNGTIDNYKELATSYGISLEDHNDSKVLLSILFYGNHDVLTKYVGTAALVWQNHITGKTYIFKGESKAQDYSKVVSEERPLFTWTIGPNNIYFSSIEESLKFIGGTNEFIIDLATNTLFVFKQGILVGNNLIDRSNCLQNTPYVYDKTKYKDNSINWNKHRNLYAHFGFANHKDWDDLPFKYSEGKNSLPAIPTKYNVIGRHDNLERIAEFHKNLHIFIRKLHIDEPVRLQAEINNDFLTKGLKRAVFNKGRFWMNKGLMHGIYPLNVLGAIPGRYTKDIAILKIYYFIEGIMMDGILAYKKALKIHEDFMMDLKQNPIYLESEEQDFTSKITKYSAYPTVSLTDTYGEQDCRDHFNKEDSFDMYYTGSFAPLFSNKEYTFDKGDLVSIIDTKKESKTATHSSDDQGLVNLYFSDCKMSVTKTSEYIVGYRLYNLENMDNPFSPFQNILLATSSLKDEKSIQLMLIHFLRDFTNSVRGACSTCEHKNHFTFHSCTDCNACKKTLATLLEKEVNYEVFN